MKYFVLILICAAINSLDDTNEAYRKLYGLSFHKKCGNYFITFKCMTACKSMGFQVFRLDFKCKCSCHELKTTTILPAFVWRTNGTTKKLPPTFSPKLYDIVGTMSPPPTETKATVDHDFTGDIPFTHSGCQENNNNTVATTDASNNGSETISANSTAPIGHASDLTTIAGQAVDVTTAAAAA